MKSSRCGGLWNGGGRPESADFRSDVVEWRGGPVISSGTSSRTVRITMIRKGIYYALKCSLRTLFKLCMEMYGRLF